MYQPILVATGASAWSEAAVEHAVRLAQAQQSVLCLLHVVPARAPRDQEGADAASDTILAGLGAYGIPPGQQQGVLKGNIVQQAQGVIHGMAGKWEWHVFPPHQFLQMVDSDWVRFFPSTDVGQEVPLAQIERLEPQCGLVFSLFAVPAI